MGEQAGYGVAAIVLTMFGVAMPMPAFAGGMMLSLGMCFAVMMVRPITARRGIGLTLLMGALAGVFAAMLNRSTGSVWVWGGLPIQAQMGIAGGLSQAAFEIIGNRGYGFLGKIADKAGFPQGDGQ